MTQISNMKVISHMVDFIKFIKFWHLSIEFYGVYLRFESFGPQELSYKLILPWQQK